jgi:hypothetical protein
MDLARLNLTRDQLEAFCRAHRIHRLAVFGSVLREDFGANSDVDVLVEFEPGVRVGLEFFEMQDELAALVGRQVDLLSFDSIRNAYRDAILTAAEDLYVAA